MIRGAHYWDVRDTFYTQTNNALEELLRKRPATCPKCGHEFVFSPLESCGPTSAVNCMAALGYDLAVDCPGPWRPQPEDVLADWFNDPRNYSKMQAARTDITPRDLPGNRVPQYYPLAVKDVFGARCDFAWINSLGRISEYLAKGYALQLCYKSPGHYVAAVAWDDESAEIIYRDPWPGRTGTDGYNLRMGQEEYEIEVQPFALVYVGG